MSWLSDWQYRKKITIQGQSGAGTDYQVLLKVGESSGASGYDFHVEGHSANFPSDTNQSGDLRFTKSDGTTLLKFWVEKVEGTSPNRVAYCWVKIADNLDNNVNIYCYYGNPNADNVSNGDDTFIFFDDASSNKSANYEWVDIYDTPFSPVLFYDSANKEYDLSHSDHDNEFLKIKDVAISNVCARAKFKITDSEPTNPNDQFGFFLRHSGLARPNDKGYLLRFNRFTEPNRISIHAEDGGINETSLATANLSENINLNDFYEFEAKVYGNNFSCSIRKLDGTELASTSASDSTYNYDKIAVQFAYHQTTKVSFKDLIIRKYISPEPSFSSASSELNTSNWNYRKKITIQGQSGAGTDYQVLLKVGESSGASGCDFHVEGHSANFPNDTNQSGDLRFTKSDGTTLLSFWVEKVEGTSPNRVAYCWVKITDNLDNNVDIYCYYGNSGATNISNGDDTFIFFDDFQGSSLDSNKWDGDGSYSVADGHITLQAGGNIKSKNEFAMENTTVEALVKVDSNYRLLLAYMERKVQYDVPGSSFGEWQLWDNSGNKLDHFDGLDPTVGSYQWWKLRYLSNEIKIYLDADYVGNFSDSYRTTSKVEAYHWYSGTTEIDQCRIRKYISPEPSFLSVSTEQLNKLNVTDWQYRKKITIQGQSGAGTNYQVLLKVGESLAPSSADDNFDDNIINTYLWKKIIHGNNVKIEEKNGRIEASITATEGTNYGLLQSKFHLSGDFDIQIDFSNLNLENKNFTFARGFEVVVDSLNYAYCQLQYASGTGRAYHAGIKVNGNETYNDISSSHTSGKFRITRQGQTLTCYYWDGSDWQQIHQRTDFSTENVYVNTCYVYNTNQCGQVSVHFDNFKVNEGTILNLKPFDFDVESHSANFPNANDNFDDNIIDSYLWRKIISGNVTLEEQNGRIEASISATSGTNTGKLRSKFFLSGNFDIQIDFSNLNLESKEFGFIRLAITVDSDNYAYCQREYRNSYGHNYYAGIKINGSETDGHVSTSDTSGKLRITRQGQTLTCYYWDGSSWQQIHQRTGFSTNDVSISICEIYSSADHPQISAYFDNFKINEGTVLKPSSGDLRFTKDDEVTLLDFWVEKVEGTSPNRIAYVWVKILDNLDNNVNIYCYYGNPNANNVSNGDNTFIFFDDFEGTDIDTNKWTFVQGTQGNGNYSVWASVLSWTHLPFGIKYAHAALGNAALRARYYQLNPTDHGSGLVWRNDVENKAIFNIWRDTNDLVRLIETNQTAHDVSDNLTSWGILEFLKDQNDNISIYLNSRQQNGSYINSYDLDALYIGNRGEASSYDASDFKFDWILIRKYISPEPLFSSVGNEEGIGVETYSYNYQADSFIIRCIDSSLPLDSLLYPFQRKLVRRSDGSFIAVYHKEINNVCQIFLASSNDNGITWSSIQITNSSYDQKYPAVIVDTEDDVHLVWLSQIDSNTYKIAYECQLNGQWQDTEIIGDAVENSAPTITFSNKNDNIIYVSWHSLGNEISIRKKINDSWQSPHEFSTGIEQLFPCITVDNDAKYHLVWSIKKAEDQPYQIVYSNENRFPDKDVLAESEGNNYPIILIDLNNNIYVCWRDKGYGNNPNYYNIVYRKNDGNGWTNIQNISDEDHNQLAPSASATIENDIYAVWSGLGWQNNPTFYNIQYRKSGQSIQSVTDIDRHQWFPNTIYSLYPKVFGIHTNVPKQGFGFIWLDDIYLKFYNFNLDWQSAIWKHYSVDVLLVNKTTNLLDVLLRKFFTLDYSLDLLLEKHIGTIIKEDVTNENLKSQRRLIRKDNNLYCVYIYNNQLYLATSDDNGQTWTEGQVTNESNPQSEPDIAVDSEGYIHIVWVNNGNIYYIRRIEEGFNTPIQITTEGDQHSPIIIIDANDNGYITWYGKTNNTYNIYIAYLNTATGQITNIEQITNNNLYDQINPILAIDGSYLHLIWTGKGYGSNPNFYNLQYKRKALDGNWYPQENITDKPYDQNFPSAIVDLDGNLNVVWQGKGWGNNPNTWNIIFRKRTAATSVWEDEEIITDKAEDQIQPSISVDSYSNINVIWTGKAWGLFTNHFNIQYKQKTASAWSSIRHITDTSNDHYWPNFISSIYPIIDEVHTNIPKTGYAFSWIDKSDLRYYVSSDLEWEIPENKFLIAQNIDYLGQHPLARDSDGRLWIAYSKKIGDYYHIFVAYSEDNGKTWIEEQITSGNRHQKYSSIVIDSLNNIHLVYLDCTDQLNICYKKGKFGNWSDAEIIDTSLEEFNPITIAIDSQDNIHVAWKKFDTTENLTYIAYKKKTESGWQNLEEASPKHNYDDYPYIAIDDNDNVHLVFTGKYGINGHSNVQYRKRTSSGWQSRIALENVDYESENCYLCLDDDGNIYVSWNSGANIYTRSYINGEWKDKYKLTNLPEGTDLVSKIPTLSSTKGGKIHVIYIGMTEDSPTPMYYHSEKSVATTDWSDSENILDIYSYYEGPERLIWANWPQISYFKPNRPKSGYAFVYEDLFNKELWFFRSLDLKWDKFTTATERFILSYIKCNLLTESSVNYQVDLLNLKEKLCQYNVDSYLCLAKLLNIEALLLKELYKSYDIDLKFVGMKKLNVNTCLRKPNILEYNIDMFIIKDGVIFSETLLKGKADYNYFLDTLIQELNKTSNYNEDVLLKIEKSINLNIDSILKPTKSFDLDILLKGFGIVLNYPIDMCINDTYISQFNIDSILSTFGNKSYSVDMLIPTLNRNVISIDMIISNKFTKSLSLSNSLVYNFKSTVLLPFLLDLRNVLINELLSPKYKGFYLRNSIANVDIFKSLSLVNSYEKFAANQSLINELSEVLNKILYLLNALANINIENRQFIVNSLQQLVKTNQLQNELGDAFSSILAILNDLVKPISKTETISSDILNYLVTNQSLRNELSYLYPSEQQIEGEEICTRFLEYNDWDIKLDGTSIKDKVTEINVYRRESEIFNHIELTIVDPKLFKQCDPYYNSGLERIELRTNDKTMKFLLESREGSEENREFSIWGRCKAAILSEPFSIKTSYVIKDKKASEIAKELAGSIDVDWQIYDFYVKEFTYEGYPIDGISRLAEVIGGIVRTKSDGSLLVRYKFPVRPKDLQNVNAVYELDRYSNLVSLDYSEEAALYDSVEVRGADYSEMQTYFSIETDKTCFEIGKEDAILRVYKYPFDVDYTVFSTDGEITKISSNKTEEITENINIENESGSTSKYIDILTSYEWIGNIKKKNEKEPLGSIEFDGNNIQCTNCAGAYLRVNYKTKYDEWKLSCDKETEVKSIVIVPEGETVVLNVVIGDGNRPASPIQDELITEEYMAVLRGQAFLDDNYYQKIKHTVKLPYVDIEDGQVVSLADDYYNLYGNYLVKQSDINITLEEDTLKIWLSLNIEKYRKVL